MSTTIKIVLSLLLLLVLFIGGNILYCWLTYIDDTVTEGSAYGFTINETKEEVYQKAREVFSDKPVYILYPLNSRNWGPHLRYYFTPEEYYMLANQDFWRLYFRSDKDKYHSYSDSLKLKFKDNKLIRIHRHRQFFELP